MSKIKDVENNYIRDMASCAHTYLYTVLCPGGRPIVWGYFCPHCGIDTSHGDCNGVIGFKKKEETNGPPMV